jgi:hypothetical protein
MKTAVAFLALAGATNAFVPASTSSSKNGLQAVFDDYVGNVNFMGTEMNFDPVSTFRPRSFNSKMTSAICNFQRLLLYRCIMKKLAVDST